MAAEQDQTTEAADLLVVDDNIDNLRLLSQILTQAGYHVRAVEKPQLAIKTALAYPPDLILLDVMMPEMDGFEVCRRLEEQEPTSSIPIIFISALTEVDAKIRGFEAGGVDYISKPFQKAEVLARVKTHLQLRDMQLHLEAQVAERTSELTRAYEALQTELTERKRAEQKLLVSEERFRAIFEQAAVGVSQVDPAGRFLRLNQKFCEIVGYSRGEMLALTYQDITHPDDLDADLGYVEQLLNGETDSYSMEKRYFHKDGKIVWVNLTVSLVQKDTGEPRYFISVVEDITDRKQVEEQYRTFFTENVSPVFWIEMRKPIPVDLPVEEQVDAIFREAYVKDVSDSTARMYGLTREELLGEMVAPWSAAGYQDRNSDLHQYYQRFVRSGYADYSSEIQERTEGGREIWLLMSIKGIVEDGRLVRIWGSQIDTTQRVDAENALRDSEAKLRALHDNAGYAIGVSKEGFTISVNPAYLELFGYVEASELIGRPLTEQIAPQERERVRDIALRRAKGDPVPGFYETLGITRDGIVFDMDVRVSSYEQDGEIYGVAILRDISERREAEKEILEYQQRLRMLASELTLVEERQRRHIAAELHDHVGQSLALARIQLATVRKNASDSQSITLLDEASQTLLETIQATRSLVFELSSPLLHEIGLEAALSEWVESNVREPTGLDARVVDDGQDKPLNEDVRVILYRNTRELLTNVIRHAGASSVCVHLERAGNEIKLSVEDDGIGMAPHTAGQNRQHEGGFGLFSIQERMNDLGGSMEIISAPGQGWTAILTAPLAIDSVHDRKST